ncbi:MAG: Trk system potassium transporter TrkA [Cellvibrionales bacterium]|nr:Trk system potassium transporter TrkA [Cellvibrionales bacterium]
MKILLLGAGSVGESLAENLTIEQNDIVIIDQDAKRLKDLQDRLDIATVCGHAAFPNVLHKAGAEDADMLIAVTDSDEINMLACQLAHTLFRISTKICRIRSNAFLSHDKLFAKDAIPIDHVISPEKLVTKYIKSLLDHPGALQVVDFAESRVRMVAVKAFYGGPIVGQALNQIPEHLPLLDTRVAAIYRRDRSIIPEGSTVVEVDDEVFFIAATDHVALMMSELRGKDKPYKRIMIVGASDIGSRLAQSIEGKYQVKLIDRDKERCKQLSEVLNRTIILHGEPSDKELLLSENIDSCDVFCALTDDDEDNIMSALLAKRLGANKVISLIRNTAYVDLVQGGDIDIALSPQQITVGNLLKHARRGEMSNVYSLRRGAAEAVEIIAKGDKKTSKVVGRKIEEINLPEGVTIGAIVRGDEVIIAHRYITIENNDHVICFLVDKNKIKEVEKLFQVGFTFI